MKFLQNEVLFQSKFLAKKVLSIRFTGNILALVESAIFQVVNLFILFREPAQSIIVLSNILLNFVAYRIWYLLNVHASAKPFKDFVTCLFFSISFRTWVRGWFNRRTFSKIKEDFELVFWKSTTSSHDGAIEESPYDSFESFDDRSDAEKGTGLIAFEVSSSYAQTLAVTETSPAARIDQSPVYASPTKKRQSLDAENNECLFWQALFQRRRWWRVCMNIKVGSTKNVKFSD